MYIYVFFTNTTFSFRRLLLMIACTENCKYQKNGECTCEQTTSNKKNSSNSNCAYFEQE